MCLTGVYVCGITCIPFCNGARPSSAVESDCVMSPCVFTLYLSTSLSLRTRFTSEVRLREREGGEGERERERKEGRKEEREGGRLRSIFVFSYYLSSVSSKALSESTPESGKLEDKGFASGHLS